MVRRQTGTTRAQAHHGRKGRWGERFLHRNGIQCDIARDVPRPRLGRGSLRSREGERDNEESLGVAVAVGGGHGGEERGGKMERTMSRSRARGTGIPLHMIS